MYVRKDEQRVSFEHFPRTSLVSYPLKLSEIKLRIYFFYYIAEKSCMTCLCLYASHMSLTTKLH